MRQQFLVREVRRLRSRCPELPANQAYDTKKLNWLLLVEEAVRMELGEASSIDAWSDLSCLSNLYRDQVVPLRASPNPRPRCEFLTANGYIGPAGSSELTTQAYVDSMASNSFLSREYFDELQRTDPLRATWRPTRQYFNFSLAMGTAVHRAHVIEAQLTIGTFQVQHECGVVPIESFDCILGVDFCHKFLVQLNWQEQIMELRDPQGKTHRVQGDTAFIKSRKLDLIVLASEVPDAVTSEGSILLMVQPLDTTYELTAEELESAAFRSRLSNACNLTSNEEQRI
eukprot:scaffold753_cov390-Pavlova_lutheri.AAC.21